MSSFDIQLKIFLTSKFFKVIKRKAEKTGLILFVKKVLIVKGVSFGTFDIRNGNFIL